MSRAQGAYKRLLANKRMLVKMDTRSFEFDAVTSKDIANKYLQHPILVPRMKDIPNHVGGTLMNA